MKLLRKLSVSIMVLLASVLCFSFTSGAVVPDGMKTISRPNDINSLEIQDAGIIFYNAKWNDMTTISVPERGWVIMDTTYSPWIGGIAMYQNPSLTKVVKRFDNGSVGGFGRSGFYLEKGTYYVQAYDGGGGYITPSADLTITIYAYFLPSSSVLSASVSASLDRTSAILHCTSKMGSGTFYRWVKDVSTTDNIKDEQFYSNRNATPDIEVKENGTYSIQISTNDQEWKDYPVDVQVTVSGIVKACEHKFTAVVDKEATCGEPGSQHMECTICGFKDAPTVIPATGQHTFTTVVDKAASCGAEGSQHRECTVCGYKEAQTAIPATGQHTFTTVVDQAASCGIVGSQHNECTVCGYKEAQTAIPATGQHTFTTVVDKAASCGAAGSQHNECTVCGYREAPITVAATGNHSYGSFVTTENPTVLRGGVRVRTCSVCGASESESLPKLEPTMKVSATKIPLEIEQSTAKLKVTGLSAGDYVQSWKSSNTKIVKVSKKGKLTAQKKTGKATVTITLASGLKKKVTVTVQKNQVATQKISGVPKKMTLGKGAKVTLKPVITPITTKDKVSYQTSDKKIVTVSSKGVVVGKKAGKAKITVTSGKKKVTVSVTVK